MKEPLQIFRHVFPGSKVYATEQITVEPYTPILRNCKGEKRRVHPEVCNWHRQDPWCLHHCGEDLPPKQIQGATNLERGEYKPAGNGGWKLKKAYRERREERMC